MRRRPVLIGLLAAIACFGAGIAAGQRFGATPAIAPQAPSASLLPPVPRLVLGQDAGARDPKIIFDPDSIKLLPDASLRLDLPPDLDAGSAP